MRVILQMILLISGLFITSMSLNSQAKDTISSRIDTLFCVSTGDTINFKGRFDTTLYHVVWVSSRKVNDTLSLSGSIKLIASDTLISYANPKNSIDTFYIDTFFISLRFSPIIDFDIPEIKCYDGDSILIISNSVYDERYTMENLEIFELDTISLSATGYNKSDNMYRIKLINGDSVFTRFSYEIQGCPTFDTLFLIGSQFTPELNFSANDVCFGDSTEIYNNSIFDRELSNVIILIDGETQPFLFKEDFKYFIETNGARKNVFIEINQQGCIVRDTLEIMSLLKPTGNFNIIETCENEYQIIEDLSSNTTISYSVSISVNNLNYNFSNDRQYTLPDTISEGTYNFVCTIENTNGCLDTIVYQSLSKPVTYVSFRGLESYYCEKQDTSILVGSENGGSFDGLFINDLGLGRAIFIPSKDTMSILVTYTYTNIFECTDSDVQTVVKVNPKPQLILDGLLAEYCENDEATELLLNQSIHSNSIYTILFDGIEINQSVGLKYLFDPSVPGNYLIRNYYIDGNLCFNEIESSTRVNPLPRVSLDSFQIIKPGNEIVVGNKDSNEFNIDYSWSNGDNRSFTVLSQPGIYFLEANNKITGCSKSDSIVILFDKDIKEDIFSIKIYPNPTSDILNIELNEPRDNIMILKLNGTIMSVQGMTSFSTDIFGKLELKIFDLEVGYYCLKIPDFGEFFIFKL